MKSLFTDTGNIVNDTILCDSCYRIISNRNHARDNVSTSDGIDRNGEFKHVPDACAVTCCVCGEHS